MIRKMISNSEECSECRMLDCIRIQALLFEMGYESSLRDCEVLWGNYSDSYAAGWLFLDLNDEDLKCALDYLLIGNNIK